MGGVFDDSNVQETASNDALPVVFAAGCSTGQFIMDFPWNGEYVDISGTRHIIQAPATPPQPGSDVYIDDRLIGQKWVVNSGNSCPSNPVVMPKPNSYDFDRSNLCFAYPWLVANAPGGAIAYFGEMGIAEDWMGR